MVSPSSSHTTLFSSITSIELRKIVFRVERMFDWKVFPHGLWWWTVVGGRLCALVDRLLAAGYRHSLEVELRLMKVVHYPGEYDFRNLMSRFREKGVVTIIDTVHGDRVLHSSRCIDNRPS